MPLDGGRIIGDPMVRPTGCRLPKANSSSCFGSPGPTSRRMCPSWAAPGSRR